MTSPDRRQGRRASFDSWVEITASGKRLRGAARDLGTGGIGIQLSGPCPSDAARLVSEFALPGIGLPLALESVVAWSDPGSGLAGLRFVDVDGGIADLLQSFVEGRL